jgi:hypothetical protein
MRCKCLMGWRVITQLIKISGSVPLYFDEIFQIKTHALNSLQNLGNLGLSTLE